MGIVEEITSGNFTLDSLWSYIGDFIKSANSDAVLGFVTKILGPIGIYVLLAIGVVELLYGKKFLNLQKFIISGIAGYYIGVGVVSPIINGIFPLSSTICGAVIALLAAVLSKMIYNIALYGGVGFLVYLLLMSNGVLPFALPTEGNMVMSIIGALVVVIIMFISRKNIDRVITAFIGAFCITTAIKNFYDYTALIPEKGVLIQIAAILLLTVLGFFWQYKRRKRYYG